MIDWGAGTPSPVRGHPHVEPSEVVKDGQQNLLFTHRGIYLKPAKRPWMVQAGPVTHLGAGSLLNGCQGDEKKPQEWSNHVRPAAQA